MTDRPYEPSEEAMTRPSRWALEVEPHLTPPPVAPPRPQRPEIEPVSEGSWVVVYLCAAVVFVLGFLAGVWACKAGGW